MYLIGVLHCRNLVTGNTFSITLEDGAVVELTVRYGGPVQENEKGEMLPLTFLHANVRIADAGYGTMLSSGIYQCSLEEATEALNTGLANPDDFMVIQGLSVWKKTIDRGEIIGGVRGDLEERFFQPVAQKRITGIWGTLMTQHLLTQSTFEENMELIDKAWSQASNNDHDKGIDRVLVFGSNVDAVELADEALSRWIKIYLLIQ